VQTWDQCVALYLATTGALSDENPKFVGAAVHWADQNGVDVEQLEGGCGAKAIWMDTAKNCRTESVSRNIYKGLSADILRKFDSGRSRSVASMVKSLALRTKPVAAVLDMMFQADFQNLIKREQVGKDLFYTIRRGAGKEKIK
jgi:hypothetical protein